MTGVGPRRDNFDRPEQIKIKCNRSCGCAVTTYEQCEHLFCLGQKLLENT